MQIIEGTFTIGNVTADGKGNLSFPVSINRDDLSGDERLALMDVAGSRISVIFSVESQQEEPTEVKLREETIGFLVSMLIDQTTTLPKALRSIGVGENAVLAYETQTELETRIFLCPGCRHWRYKTDRTISGVCVVCSRSTADSTPVDSGEGQLAPEKDSEVKEPPKISTLLRKADLVSKVIARNNGESLEDFRNRKFAGAVRIDDVRILDGESCFIIGERTFTSAEIDGDYELLLTPLTLEPGDIIARENTVERHPDLFSDFEVIGKTECQVRLRSLKDDSEYSPTWKTLLDPGWFMIARAVVPEPAGEESSGEGEAAE